MKQEAGKSRYVTVTISLELIRSLRYVLRMYDISFLEFNG